MISDTYMFYYYTKQRKNLNLQRQSFLGNFCVRISRYLPHLSATKIWGSFLLFWPSQEAPLSIWSGHNHAPIMWELELQNVQRAELEALQEGSFDCNPRPPQLWDNLPWPKLIQFCRRALLLPLAWSWHWRTSPTSPSQSFRTYLLHVITFFKTPFFSYSYFFLSSSYFPSAVSIISSITTNATPPSDPNTNSSASVFGFVTNLGKQGHTQYRQWDLKPASEFSYHDPSFRIRWVLRNRWVWSLVAISRGTSCCWSRTDYYYSREELRSSFIPDFYAQPSNTKVESSCYRISGRHRPWATFEKANAVNVAWAAWRIH